MVSLTQKRAQVNNLPKKKKKNVQKANKILQTLKCYGKTPRDALLKKAATRAIKMEKALLCVAANGRGVHHNG